MDIISVVVPVYNVEKYLNRCVDSILNQTYENIEVILVDDGSGDNSGVICDAYKEKDSRVKVIHKKNAGLGHARNSGIDIAKGEYITFIDGDDYIGRKHLQSMYEEIKRTDTDSCLGGHTKVYAKKKVEHRNVCAGKVYYKDVKEQILSRMCGADNTGNDYIEMSVCMVLMSNRIIQENNLRFVSERELISEDLFFDFFYYPLSKGVCCSEICDYYYCDNEGSLTTKYRQDRFASQVKLYGSIREKAQELGIEELCLPRMNTTLIAIARYSIKLEDKFEKTIGSEKSKENIKRIYSDPLLISVLAEYNDKKTRIPTRIVNLFMKKKCYFILKIIMRIKNLFSI